MIVYSVTCLVEDSIKDEWMDWMKSVHLPEVMATGKFVSHQMFSIDPHDEQDTGTSFNIQYLLETRELLQDYSVNHGPALKAKTLAKYGERVIAFRTVLESV
jgi:hypothetical protein